MSLLTLRHAAIVLMTCIGALACAEQDTPPAAAVTEPAAATEPQSVGPAEAEPAVDETQAATWPRLVVHKSPTCGCCGLWVEHMQDAGFPVEVRDTHALHAVKEQLGVPYGKGSCHTAQVDGYLVEGHVPAEDVKRLLTERPDARGLVLPGMPLGSPGMETPDGRTDAYTVELVANDGTTTAFARH